MSERYAQYDGGKGPEDRSTNAKREKSALWKIVRLPEGVSLTPEEAVTALHRAADILHNSVGEAHTDESYETEYTAWFKDYFPEHLQFQK
jgi:hypothetical protein